MLSRHCHAWRPDASAERGRARAGNALAARGQLAGSAWAALGSDLALWRVNQEIARVL